MSYQTKYQLEWTDDLPTIPQVAQVLALTTAEYRGQDLSKVTPERMNAATQYWEGVLAEEEETTWYEHEADMAHVSALWDKVDFRLYLNGEESGDFAVEYYRGGLVQYASARVEYPELDPELLKSPGGDPAKTKRPDTFFHQGWLARAQTGGYWVVPMASPEQPEGAGTGPAPGAQGLLLETSSRAEAVRMISSWRDSSEGGPKPRRPVRQPPPSPEARAKQAVLDVVQEASKNADPETALAISEWLKTAALPGD